MPRLTSALGKEYQLLYESCLVPANRVADADAIVANLKGDPLTDRTKNVPAGRPTKGNPPFSWEESATDALNLKGCGRWKDWNVPGILYKLEEYNWWGYRDHHPDVLSPYLWSFSNHYTRGNYVADGTFSPSAVSQQCGVAVLLKRLRKGGTVVVDTGPRVLQLSNSNMVGADVDDAQPPFATAGRAHRTGATTARSRSASRRRTPRNAATAMGSSHG